MGFYQKNMDVPQDPQQKAWEDGYKTGLKVASAYFSFTNEDGKLVCGENKIPLHEVEERINKTGDL